MKTEFKSFVFPETIKKQIDALPAESQLKFYKAVTDFGMYDIEPDYFTGLEQIVWISMQDLLVNSKNKRAGAPLGNSNATKTINSIENNQNNSKTINSIDLIEKQLNQSENNKTTLNNVNVNVNDNDNVNDNHTHNVNTRVCENNQNNQELNNEDVQNWQDFQKQSFELIQEHNKNSDFSKKLCISNSFASYLQKECRNIISELKQESPAIIYKALQNYLLVAKSDTWKKTFSVNDFINNFATYSDEDFNVSKFLKTASEPTSGEDKKTLTPEELEVQLLEENKTNKEFIPSVFNFYKEDWINEGCPTGKDYFYFQDEICLRPYGQKLKEQYLAQGA